MNGPDDHPNDIYSGLYSNGRTDDDRENERRAIETQAERMAGPDLATWQALIAEARNRRAERDDLPQLSVVDRDVTVVVVTGELLVRTPTTAEAMAHLRTALDDLGFVEFAAPPELGGRVMRWRATTAVTGDDLDHIARGLRAQRFIVSVNHIVPLNPWMKAAGGPEPTAGRGIPAPGEIMDGPLVAVIDTGIVGPARPDGWLEEIDRAHDGSNVDPLKWSPNDPFLGLGAGHGTFVAGLVAQVAQVDDQGCRRPAGRVVVRRALDVDGVGSEVDLAVEMIRAVQDGARIVNLSLGAQTLDDQPPVAVQAALEVIDEIEGGTDVLIVAAAGNFADTRPCWPAAFRRVVAVAGLSADGHPAPWSSRGFWVQCSTVAQGVVSTYVAGRESPIVDPDGEEFLDDAWGIWLGTSFAAPQISGLVSRLCAEQPGLSPRGALAQILAVGIPLPDYGRAVRILPGT